VGRKLDFWETVFWAVMWEKFGEKGEGWKRVRKMGESYAHVCIDFGWELVMGDFVDFGDGFLVVMWRKFGKKGESWKQVRKMGESYAHVCIDFGERGNFGERLG
jgi:uncharacterized protein (DUF736 family)